MFSTKPTAGSAIPGFRLKATRSHFSTTPPTTTTGASFRWSTLRGKRRFFLPDGKVRKGWLGPADGSEVWFSAAQAGLQRRIYAVDLSGHQRLVFRAPGGVTLHDIAPDGRVLLTRDEQRAG